jgi:hypothetical protein
MVNVPAAVGTTWKISGTAVQLNVNCSCQSGKWSSVGVCVESYFLHGRLRVGKFLNSDFAVYGKSNRAPFSKCSVTEKYFELRSVWDTAILEVTTKFRTFIVTILLPCRSPSYTLLVRGNVNHWHIYIYIYRKLSDKLACCKNLFSWSNIITALNFVDKCNGLRKSRIKNNCFFRRSWRHSVYGGQLVHL